MSKIEIISDITEYTKAFLTENAKVNLISKNDEKYLFEKHIYDSLGIKLFFEKYKIKTAKILDIGCGGGFPCVPMAIEYPNLNIIGIDSIGKKIQAVNNIKNALGLKNLTLIYDRVENIKNEKYDIIVSRAVSNLSKICSYALPLLKKDGYFVAYKSRKSAEEIFDSETILQKYNAKIIDIISYTLPMEELYERKLVIIKQQ